jgi:hypothetical protein
MSNNASLSSAKRRRGGAPPPMSPQTSGAGSGNLPPGLPPNFRQLPPQVQQQMLRQIQMRGPPPPPPHPAIPPSMHANIPTHINKVMSAPNAMGGGAGAGAASNGPYVVNSVLHNRATGEVAGLHIRDLPMTSTGLPCLPSGAPLPPNVLFKLHHDELLNQDATLNEHSNRLQLLTNRVDKIEKSGGGSGGGGGGGYDEMSGANGSSYESIVEDGTFIAKVVDNILTNTNLSDIINQIEPLQKENEALRALLNSQQTTLNELSGLVMKLLNNGLPTYGSNNANNGDYLSYDASASIAEYNADDVTKVDTNSNAVAVDSKDVVVEEAEEAEEADALEDEVES